MTVTTVPRIVGDIPLVGVYSYPPIGDTLEGQALAIARKYSASVYLPGVTNYSDAALSSVAVNDGSVGGVVGQRIGPELVTNGDFSDGLTGWTNINTPFPTVSSGILTVERTIGFVGSERTITCETGKSYIFTGQAARSAGTGVPVLRVRTGSALTGVVVAESIVSSPNASLTSYSFIFTATQATNYVQLVVNTANATCQFDNISVKELGYIATQSTAGFKPTLKSAARPHHWLFDGVDDRLSLSGPLFQMSDDHFVVACVKTDKATSFPPVFVEHGATSQYIYLGFDTGKPQVIWRDDAAVTANIIHGSSISIPFVMSAIKQSSAKRLRVNSTQSGATDNTVMGATTLTTTAIGYYSIGGYIHQGPIYGVIAGKGTITDAELLVLENYLASRGGFTL